MEKRSSKDFSRRDFLKTAAAVGAGAAALGIPRPGYAAGTDAIKIGVIGCGGRGRQAAQNAIAAGKSLGVEVRVAALGDSFEQVAKATQKGLEKQPGGSPKDDVCFWGLDNYKKVVAQELDYVILAAPPGFRPEHFEAVINAKKHCFCEKPVATDPVGIRRYLAAAAKSKELKLSVTAGTQRRHENRYIETIKKIQDGAIGEVRAAYAYWLSSGAVFKERDRKPEYTDIEWQIRAWYSYCWVCGDHIVEQHVHNLDIMNWVMGGHPVRALASGGRAWKNGERGVGDIFDMFTVDYEYPNGVHMLAMCRHWYNSVNKVEELVIGAKGKSNCCDMGEGGDGYVNEHRNLILSMTNQGPYFNESEQVAETTMTGILGRESAYTGRALTWDQIMKSDLELVPKNMTWDMKLPEPPVPTPGKPDWKRAV